MSETQPPAILIVDDSVTVRMDLQQIFQSAGYESSGCADLAAARQALLACRYSLVILDVLLPDGDGIELLREIKADPQAPPVILLSTEGDVRDRVRGIRTGADDYVGKPYESNYLLARARQLISSSRPQLHPEKAVLLIDDSATFREFLKAQLEAAGYTVFLAANGEEGVRAALAFRPNVIVVDGVLGNGVMGWNVIGRLKQDISIRATPCLLLTGSEEGGGELGALDAGADAFLRKDAAPDLLLARLAALERSALPDAASSVCGTSLFGAKKILTVDDSLTFLQEISRVLHEEGYDVAPAHSGHEALDLLEAQPVDCILLDQRMPGLSGEETCRIIKNRPAWKNIPLILYTGVEETCAMVDGINAGADDYVPKSTDFEVLKARIRAQLRRKQFEDEHRRVREELLKKEIEAAEARAGRMIAEERARMVDELERKNRELEAFAYAVSHDLRSPLRAISGFTRAVLVDRGGELPDGSRNDLERVQVAANRMSQLIDSLLQLSHCGLGQLKRQKLDLSAMARGVAAELTGADRERQIEFSIEDGVTVTADAQLVRVLMTNLIGNAWKFSGKVAHPQIAFGAFTSGTERVYFVKDNGAGFDPQKAERLFQPFERLHPATEFPGTGIGLATVRRIVERHGGRVWAESAVGQGAAFFFTLEASSSCDLLSGRLADAAYRH